MPRASTLSLLLPLALWGCPDPVDDPDAATDAGVTDAAPADAGPRGDAGFADAGEADAGFADSGVSDAGVSDAGEGDAGAVDGGPAPFPITVAYSATETQATLLELFLTETSTSRRRLHGDLAGQPAGGEKQPETGGIESFGWLPDGAGVWYVAHEETFDLAELYLTAVEGARPGAHRKLSLPSPASSTDAPVFSPGNPWLVFSQVPEGESRGNLYLLPYETVGIAPLQIDMAGPGIPAWDPTGRYVTFQDIIVSADDRDLWLVDAAAFPTLSSVRVNPGANLGYARARAFSPDGTRIAYAADESALRVFELFIADVDGNTITNRTRVHPAFGPAADIPFEDDAAQFSPDGTRLAFTHNAGRVGLNELYVSDVSGATPGPQVALTGAFPKGATGVETFGFSPDGSRVVIVADQELAGEVGLYVSDGSGAAPQLVHSGPQIMFEKVWVDTTVFFRSVSNGVARLHYADVGSLPPAAPVELAPMTSEESVSAFAVSPSGRQVVFRTRVDDQHEMYWADLTDPAQPTVVRLGATAFDGAWCWAPDDRLAAVLLDPADGSGHLYWIEDPTAPRARRISGPLVPGTRVHGCAFAP